MLILLLDNDIKILLITQYLRMASLPTIEYTREIQ